MEGGQDQQISDFMIFWGLFRQKLIARVHPAVQKLTAWMHPVGQKFTTIYSVENVKGTLAEGRGSNFHTVSWSSLDFLVP